LIVGDVERVWWKTRPVADVAELFFLTRGGKLDNYEGPSKGHRFILGVGKGIDSLLCRHRRIFLSWEEEIDSYYLNIEPHAFFSKISTNCTQKVWQKLEW